MKLFQSFTDITLPRSQSIQKHPKVVSDTLSVKISQTYTFEFRTDVSWESVWKFNLLNSNATYKQIRYHLTQIGVHPDRNTQNLSNTLDVLYYHKHFGVQYLTCVISLKLSNSKVINSIFYLSKCWAILFPFIEL